MSTEIEVLRAATQDAGTRHAIYVTNNASRPALALLGWWERFQGADGLGCWDHRDKGLRLIHSIARCEGEIWSHVSVSRRDHQMPTWEQARDVFRLVHPKEYGIIVVAPPDKHVNIAEVAHVWCCMSRPYVPDFTHGMGTI